jgi:hypothetical protein
MNKVLISDIYAARTLAHTRAVWDFANQNNTQGENGGSVRPRIDALMTSHRHCRRAGAARVGLVT